MARKHRTDRGLFVYRLSDGSELYGVRLYRHGRAHKWQGFRRKSDARDWYEARKRDLREGKAFPARGEVDGVTVAERIEQYLAQATNKKNYGGECNYGKFWTGRIGRMLLTEVSPHAIDQARTHLLTTGAVRRPVSHATVNRYVAWFHHVCQVDIGKGLLDKNPCRLVKFKERKAPEVEYTPQEEAALARELGDQAAIPTLAILTGLRQEEQFNLRWDALDLDRGYGKLHDPKGGEPQVFLINASARDILWAIKRRTNGSPWVFPRPNDPSRPINGETWYKAVFAPAAKRAGIHLSRQTGKTYHTLRHTFASRLQQNGVEVKDIKDLGRWKSWKAMERYLKRDTARLRSAIEKLQTAHKPPLIAAKKRRGNVQSDDKHLIK